MVCDRGHFDDQFPAPINLEVGIKLPSNLIVELTGDLARSGESRGTYMPQLSTSANRFSKPDSLSFYSILDQVSSFLRHRDEKLSRSRESTYHICQEAQRGDAYIKLFEAILALA